MSFSVSACGLAEQASAFPTSGGQYHAAFMVASPGTRRATSFFTGAFGLVAWALLTVSATIYVGELLPFFPHSLFLLILVVYSEKEKGQKGKRQRERHRNTYTGREKQGKK